jgi:heme/copper-type cytochrome/quinol oxidase subunit 2
MMRLESALVMLACVASEMGTGIFSAGADSGKDPRPHFRATTQPASPQVVRVTAERFAFTPSEIVVEKGTVVEFHLRSEDTDHGFRIAGTDIDVAIPKRRRGEAVVRYTADTEGRFTIECSRPCGAGHTAMRAVLIVKSPD